MHLFTIGDSLSQGFMSLAAAKTDLCFSTIISKALNPNHASYLYPQWPHRMPADLEAIMRALYDAFGNSLQGRSWKDIVKVINSVLNPAEQFYERGAGRENVADPVGINWYHNVAVEGFEVADAWLVTPDLCKSQIRLRNSIRNNLFGAPSKSFYRVALRVLNPSKDPSLDQMSQLDWLAYHSQTEGVENVLLWLGANNALGTVLKLDINETPGDGSPFSLKHRARKKRNWNLWHPFDFKLDYTELLARVRAIMAKNKSSNWKVYVATIPSVTATSILKGFGSTQTISGQTYYESYSYFLLQSLPPGAAHLTQAQAINIDTYIAEYNEIIRRLLAEENSRLGESRYVVVDIASAVNQMAWGKNNGNPTYQLPPEVAQLGIDAQYYHVDQAGQRQRGGIFSLDGVHPSAIGQGLIAWEFLKVMNPSVAANLNWAAIIARDELYNKPIALMPALYNHQQLTGRVVRLLGLLEII